MHTQKNKLLNSPHFGLFLFSGINNGSAADFSNLASLAVERPAAYLVSQHVFNKQHSAIETQPQLIKQLDVFQEVIIWVAMGGKGEVYRKLCHQLKNEVYIK